MMKCVFELVVFVLLNLISFDAMFYQGAGRTGIQGWGGSYRSGATQEPCAVVRILRWRQPKVPSCMDS